MKNKVDMKDVYIESLKAELRGLRWSFDMLYNDYVRLNNKYRKGKLDYRKVTPLKYS